MSSAKGACCEARDRAALPSPSRWRGSRRQLVLAAIRNHFRRIGDAPSHREIAALAGIEPRHVPREIDALQREGWLTYRRGQRRSIRLADRCANISDDELVLALIARGGTVTFSAVPALSDAYPVVTGVRDDEAEWLHRIDVPRSM